jgi:hypothetical protein
MGQERGSRGNSVARGGDNIGTRIGCGRQPTVGEAPARTAPKGRQVSRVLEMPYVPSGLGSGWKQASGGLRSRPNPDRPFGPAGKRLREVCRRLSHCHPGPACSSRRSVPWPGGLCPGEAGINPAVASG